MTAEVNGTMIWYEDAGSGDAVILVHGNGEDHTVFDVLTASLVREHRVIAPDSRDHGRSEKLKEGQELHYTDMAEDIARLIMHLGLDKPALYGFSDGGIIGLIIAAKYPGLLGKLMISGANTSPGGVKVWFRILSSVIYLFKPSPKLRLMIKEPQITKEQLESIVIPVLVMAGSKDLIPERETRWIASSLRHATLKILPGETHSSYVVHSEKLYGLLSPFLREGGEK